MCQTLCCDTQQNCATLSDSGHMVTGQVVSYITQVREFTQKSGFFSVLPLEWMDALAHRVFATAR